MRRRHGSNLTDLENEVLQRVPADQRLKLQELALTTLVGLMMAGDARAAREIIAMFGWPPLERLSPFLRDIFGRPGSGA